MSEPEAAAELGQGPRGRRLGHEVQRAGGATDAAALLAALADAVSWATYWQEPDAWDRQLATPAARDALSPVAAAVAAAPAAAWWWTPAALDDQHYVEWIDPRHDHSPALTGAPAKLAAWRRDTLADEDRAAERPADPRAPWSGHWWSTPALSGLPATTRAAAGLGAVALALTEDAMGWHEARVWPVHARPGARVYELTGPAAWTELVRRYPLEVTRSRRHDWFRATGRAGRWLIPDYAAVAADWDAVHLTVAGYLSTAGAACPVDRKVATVLAGWNPDQTWWLTDALTLGGPATYWVNPDGGGPGWRAASTQSPQ
ncbi:MAG TPA: hypothetical protein VIZ20_02735 [Streptosporangiaceae bacterium]